MNIQAKSSLILIITLILGIVLGVMIDRTLIHRSFEQRIERFRSPGVFFHIFERILEPDENQSKEIRKILEKHAEKMAEYRNKTRKEMAALVDSLHAELDPILSDEQRMKLKDAIQKLQRMHRRPPFGPKGRRPQRPFEQEPPPPNANFDPLF